MIRLGLRLAFLGGRWSVVPTVLTAVAVAFGTAILLYALSFTPALEVRYDRGAWRDTPGPRAVADQVPGTTLISLTNDRVEGLPLARIDVAPLGSGGPVPPGLERLPDAGQTFVSPALAALLAERPPAELADRFGTVVGTIGDEGLRAPNELVAINGLPPAKLAASGSRAVTAFDTEGQPPTLDLVVNLMVVVAVIGAIAPVAVFVASATRLAAARRERRLAALRLSGATSGQVALLAAVDALLISVPGALLGVVVFFALRPLVASFQLGDLTWFADAVVPPLVPAALVVGAVPVVGVAAAVVALRRMSISPLGVARRVSARPPGRWRIVPVAVALVAFAASLALGATPFRDIAPIGAAVSFFAIVAGIAIVGPLLTSIIGWALARGGGAVRMLAGRHLLNDPRASFTAVTGVVLAIFVASAFFGFVSFTNSVSGTTRVGLLPNSLYVEVPPSDGSAAEAAVEAARGEPGAGPVALVREAAVVDPADPEGGAFATAWIVRCADLLAGADLPGASCGDAAIHLVTGTIPAESGLLGYAVDADSEALAGPMTVETSFDATAPTERLLPPGVTVPPGSLPDLIIDPSVVEGDGRNLRPLFVLAPTDGARATVERVRTDLEAAMPTGGPVTGAEVVAALTRIVDELGRVVMLGVVMTMAVAGASLALAVAGGLLDRRRPFALLRQSGVELRQLRLVLLLEAAAPLIAVAVLSCALGVLTSQLLLRMAAGNNVPLPDPSVAVLLAASVAGALAIVSAALSIVGPITSLEETRFE